MKIVFFGTPEFAAPILETLINIPGFEVISIVTQPDKPVGRKGKITPPPIKVISEKHEIKVLQPGDKKELLSMVKDIKADFFIVVAYGLILTKDILQIPKHGSINIHASLLPKYRGASPIQESLLNGDKETGITIMKMDEELDHGQIYFMKRLDIENDDNLITLSAKLSNLSSQVLPLVLEDIKNGILTPIEQNHAKATFCRKIKKEDGKIDWNKSAKEIINMIRGYYLWPSVYTEFNGKKLKILKAQIEDSSQDPVPGKFTVEDNVLKIGTSNGYLLPQKVQIEGKNEMEIEAFLNGYKSLISSSN